MSRILMAGSLLLLTLAASSSSLRAQASGSAVSKRVRLEDLTWVEAEKILWPETVVIPLGAAAKEHGPHLKLRNHGA